MYLYKVTILRMTDMKERSSFFHLPACSLKKNPLALVVKLVNSDWVCDLFTLIPLHSSTGKRFALFLSLSLTLHSHTHSHTYTHTHTHTQTYYTQHLTWSAFLK